MVMIREVVVSLPLHPVVNTMAPPVSGVDVETTSVAKSAFPMFTSPSIVKTIVGKVTSPKNDMRQALPPKNTAPRPAPERHALNTTTVSGAPRLVMQPMGIETRDGSSTPKKNSGSFKSIDIILGPSTSYPGPKLAPPVSLFDTRQTLRANVNTPNGTNIFE